MDSETADEIKRHFDAVAGGLQSEIHIVAGGLVATNEKLDRTNERLDRTAEKFDERLDRLDEKLDRRTEEIKRHFNVVAEGLRSETRTVAEGFVATNERLDRLEVQMSEGFDDVKSIIRLSFGDLDRRVQSLEKGRPS